MGRSGRPGPVEDELDVGADRRGDGQRRHLPVEVDTDVHDGGAAQPLERGQVGPRRLGQQRGSGVVGHGEHDRVGGEVLVGAHHERGPDGGHGLHPCAPLDPDAGRQERGEGGVAVELLERDEGPAEVRAGGIVEQGGPEDHGGEGEGRLRGRQVHGGPADEVPERVDRRRVLAVVGQPGGEGALVARGVVGVDPSQAGGGREAGEAPGGAQRPVAEQRPGQVERRRERRRGGSGRVAAPPAAPGGRAGAAGEPGGPPRGAPAGRGRRCSSAGRGAGRCRGRARGARRTRWRRRAGGGAPAARPRRPGRRSRARP